MITKKVISNFELIKTNIILNIFILINLKYRILVLVLKNKNKNYFNKLEKIINIIKN